MNEGEWMRKQRNRKTPCVSEQKLSLHYNKLESANNRRRKNEAKIKDSDTVA